MYLRINIMYVEVGRGLFEVRNPRAIFPFSQYDNTSMVVQDYFLLKKQTNFLFTFLRTIVKQR